MIVIFHNPKCSTSRHVLDAIQASGTEPEVVEYLKDGWTRPQLLALFANAGITPRDALRTKAPGAADLQDADDEALIAAMVKDPVLVERPIVVSAKGTALCRPVTKLLPLLENPLPDGYTRKDGKPFA